MRPVLKWTVGENGVTEIFAQYQNAKPLLKSNFGSEGFYYCNYCDRKVAGVDLNVEHILPKEQNPHLEFRWDNFLLGCTNCNNAKYTTDFVLNDVVLPHIQNTVHCFSFMDDGTMALNIAAPGSHHNRIVRTINLLGLHMGKHHAERKPQDDRYKERGEVLRIARRKLSQFEAGKQDVPDIVDCATTSGYWLVWVEVFDRHLDVKNALITSFTGTYPYCFTTNIDRV